MPAAVRASPTPSPAVARLGLGAGRFGLARDPRNPRGRMSPAEAAAVLALAADAGIRVIDTTPRHDGSEASLGTAVPRQTTAPPPFRLQTKTIRVVAGVDAVEAAARLSLARLNVPAAEMLFVESAGDLLSDDGPALWKRLQRLKGEGLYRSIGVCAHPGEDPVGLAQRFKPDVMQLPVSLLDQRLISGGVLARLIDMGVQVQFRSVFMHGLLFGPGAGGLPDAACARRLSRIRRMIAEAGCDPLHAAIAFALSLSEATAVVVGVTSAAQLKAVLAAAAAPAPALDWAALALDDPLALDGLDRAA